MQFILCEIYCKILKIDLETYPEKWNKHSYSPSIHGPLIELTAIHNGLTTIKKKKNEAESQTDDIWSDFVSSH